MGFRDEREASVQRIELLERELESAKHELDAARLRAAEVDDLRKWNADLTKDRDELMRGVGARSRAYDQRLQMILGIVLVGAVGASYVTYHWFSRREQDDIAARVRAQGEAATATASEETIRSRLAAAQQELSQIDAVHDAELGQLRASLRDARLHQAGHAFLMTFHVASRSGEVPSGVGDECVLAIRDVDHARTTGLCVAVVWCGTQQVFPVNEPSPDVHCTLDGAVGEVDARVDGRSPPLLSFDPRSRVLAVRETGGPIFALTMRLERTIPYLLR